jgi:hypothetical protein
MSYRQRGLLEVHHACLTRRFCLLFLLAVGVPGIICTPCALPQRVWSGHAQPQGVCGTWPDRGPGGLRLFCGLGFVNTVVCSSLPEIDRG